MRHRFYNRTAFITGASRGIGKEIAKKLAEGGANIAIIDIDKDALKEVSKEFQLAGYDIFTKYVDVVNLEDVKAVFKEVNSKFGSIDILVNNAGITRDNLLFKMEESDWQQVMDVHLKGAFNTALAAQEYMVNQTYGRIINISSTSALGNRGQVNYATAKAGLQGFTKTLAIELGKYGITTNAVAPGFIKTEMTVKTAKRIGVSYEDFIKLGIKDIPVERAGEPSDVANAVAFFADEKSSFVNGQVIYVAGGPKT